MKIIDSHMHLGDCRVFSANIDEKELMETLDEHGVHATVVQPFPGAADEADVHKRIYALSKKYPDRIYGFASVNPHMDKQKYQDKMKMYVEEYGFVGLKVHTIGHALHPQSVDAYTVYETAAKLGKPVMIHTGAGMPFALPSYCAPPIKEFPELTFIIGHAGAGVFSGEAILVAQEYKNVYLEPSWCSVEDVNAMINTVGSERVMFGSDSLLNIPSGLAVFRALKLTDSQMADVLCNTATKVYGLR